MHTRTPILLAGAAVLVALLLVLWFALNARESGAPIGRRDDAQAPAAAEISAADAAPHALASAPGADGRTAEVRAAAPPASDKPAAARRPDLAAREWIEFRVKDDHGAPVAAAEIQLAGLRRKSERGSCFGWRGEPSSGKTATDGTLKLPFPVWVNLDDETGEIVLYVRHPDYATFEDQGCKIAPVVDIVLKRGSTLVIAGWIGAREHVVTDVTPSFSWDVDLQPDDWFPRRDGRLTTTRVHPGTHVVYLQWQSKELGTFFSDITEFTLVQGEDLDLLLELRPAQHLVGKIGDEVPRPVVDAEVSIGIQGGAGRASVLHRRSIAVQPDGNFEFTALPPGDAQIVGLCRGWASARVRDEGPASAGSVPDEHSWMAPRLDVRSFEGLYELRMEPTAALELTLVDPDGKPAAGVTIKAWPNVCWRINACSMFLDDRSWSAKSDSNGLVRIEDVPAGEHGIGAEDPDLDLPIAEAGGGGGMRIHHVAFVSGETARKSFTLERKSKR